MPRLLDPKNEYFVGRKKPVGRVKINGNHPLAKGIYGTWPFTIPGTSDINTVTGQAVTFGAGFGVVPHLGGTALYCTGSTTASARLNIGNMPSGESTYFAKFTKIGVPGGNYVSAIFNSRHTSSTDWVAIDVSNVFDGARPLSGHFTTSTISANAGWTNGKQLVGVNPTDNDFGNLQYSIAAYYASTPALSGTSPDLELGTVSFAGSLRGFLGYISCTYIWNRKLTSDEIAWLHQDPYCFIVPDQKRTYVILPQVAGAPPPPPPPAVLEYSQNRLPLLGVS